MELAIADAGGRIDVAKDRRVLGEAGEVGETQIEGGGLRVDVVHNQCVSGHDPVHTSLLLHEAVFENMNRISGSARANELAALCDVQAVANAVGAKNADSSSGRDGYADWVGGGDRSKGIIHRTIVPPERRFVICVA